MGVQASSIAADSEGFDEEACAPRWLWQAQGYHADMFPQLMVFFNFKGSLEDFWRQNSEIVHTCTRLRQMANWGVVNGAQRIIVYLKSTLVWRNLLVNKENLSNEYGCPLIWNASCFSSMFISFLCTYLPCVNTQIWRTLQSCTFHGKKIKLLKEYPNPNTNTNVVWVKFGAILLE